MKEAEGLLKIIQANFKWAGWPFVLAAIPLLVIGFLWLRGRKKKAAGAEGGAIAPEPKLDLHGSWRAFLGKTPREYRAAVPLYQPFVVLGEAGSGKSALIDRTTDWKGQLVQFYPSHVEDPLVQIYRGSRAIVEEISAVVLEDPAARVRDALVRLWRPLGKGKTPRAVLVVSAPRLLAASPDAIVRLAQSMRGKVNVLAGVCKDAIRTSIAVTHVDQFEGYLELSGLLRDAGRPMDLGAATSAADLGLAIGALEDYLPLALAKLPAADYLKVLAFFKRGPELAERLGMFLGALGEAEPLSPPPLVERVGLASAKESGPGTWNPFDAAITSDETRRFRPFRKHQLAAAAVAASGVLYLGVSYAHERSTIDEAHQRLGRFFDSPFDPAPSGFFTFLSEQRDSPSRHLLASFKADHVSFLEEEIHREFIDGTRNKVLLARLAKFEKERDGVKALYLLALLYAGEGNKLGKYVMARQREFADVLEIAPVVIKEYVGSNDAAAKIARPIDSKAFGTRFQIQIASDAPSTVYFLDALERAVREPIVSREDLAALKTLGKRVGGELDAIARSKDLVTVAELLAAETGLDVGEEWKRRLQTAPDLDRGAVQGVLAMVDGTDLANPDPATLDLLGAVAALEQLAAPKKSAPPADVKFRVLGREVLVSGADWDRLVTRSRITLLLRDFQAHKRTDYRQAFFQTPSAYKGPPIESGPDSPAQATGKPRVEGVFSLEAFEDRLKPALGKLPTVLASLPILDQDKQAFSDWVSATLDGYAQDYVGAYRNYWDAFRVVAKTPAQLRYVLGKMQEPQSALKRMLKELAKHTALPLADGNVFFEPLAVVPNTFGFLRTLVPAQGADMPALAELLAAYGKVSAALDGGAPGGAGGAPAAPKGGDKPPAAGDEPNTLKDKLSPLGQVALSIYREEDGSFSAQVERWLLSLNIESRWWGPFSALPDQTWQLGQKEVERTVEQAWANLQDAQVTPLFGAFPFDKDGREPATQEKVDAALSPKGVFWTGVAGDLGPVLAKKGAAYAARQSRRGTLALPSQMMPTLKRLAKLRDLLYDHEGKPKAIVVVVKPLPLPPDRVGPYLVLAAYLQVGQTSAFGFNQRPDWIPLHVEWWHPEGAAAGAVFSPDGLSKKVYRSLALPDAPWSFYSLLQSAKRTGDNWRWTVAAPSGEKVAVTFEMLGDPWEAFSVE